jgi:alkylated DNA repair dioxygenase AlkB
MTPELAWQASLLDDGPPAADVAFSNLRRLELDDRSWVDFAPSWLTGSDELFALLLQTGCWQQREVLMYDRRVLEPRLTAGWSTDVDAVPPALRNLAEALSMRYSVTFDRIWVNLYRDGKDSVAWHGDRNRLVMSRPLVATVSLGARRRFLLRRTGSSRAAHELRPGHGDLVVMGGACQSEWEHTVPKQGGAAGPRMSVTLRHAQPAAGQRWLQEPSSVVPGHAW